jgi:hypothetical protein
VIGSANPVAPGAPFDAFAEAFDPGLVGQITVAIYDQNDNLLFGPTAAGITEIAPIGSLARYGVTLYAPDTPDTYLVVWDDNEADPNSASEELIVGTAGGGTAPTVEWITGDDIAECCDITGSGSDVVAALDDAAAASNDILFVLSGRQFEGLAGPVTVRPTVCHTCGTFDRGPWMSRGYVGAGGLRCACLSKVTLAGVPVREIIAVKVDGAFLTSADYRLDYQRDLIRMRDVAAPTVPVAWPARQILDLPNTEENTWSVTYTYGADPPQMAVTAAKELGCEIYKMCSGADDCQIPSGVTKVVRQGVTLDRSALATALAAGAVGLASVDLFLGTYNPDQLPQRSAVWSPDTQQYPYRPGG